MIRSAQEVKERVVHCLRAASAPPDVTEIQAEWLIEAELRGHASHGIERLPLLLKRLAKGLIIPAALPSFNWRSPGLLLVDGNHGLGPPTILATISELASRVRQQGICLAGVKNCAHLGILSPYLDRITSANLIGLIMTSTEALVHPWGGTARMVGTNPIAVGLPAQPYPVIVDLATSVISMGEVIDYASRGLDLQPDWAITADGEPTTNPAAAIRGALNPLGGAKGYALGLAIGVLVATCTGTALGRDVVGTLDAEHPISKGDVVMLIDPQCLGGPDQGERITSYLVGLRQSRPASPAQPVQIPGDGSRKRRAVRIATGIDVEPALWRELEEFTLVGCDRNDS